MIGVRAVPETLVMADLPGAHHVLLPAGGVLRGAWKFEDADADCLVVGVLGLGSAE
jgi:hypothetical protein